MINIFTELLYISKWWYDNKEELKQEWFNYLDTIKKFVTKDKKSAMLSKYDDDTIYFAQFINQFKKMLDSWLDENQAMFKLWEEKICKIETYLPLEIKNRKDFYEFMMKNM